MYDNWTFRSDSETVEETVEEYDGDGKLVRKTITKTTRTKPQDYNPYRVTY